jgi:hypothetical protein
VCAQLAAMRAKQQADEGTLKRGTLLRMSQVRRCLCAM